MSEHFYKERLYPFQDEVLNILAQVDSPFYLTGGTALSRCHLHHRYSDDLDFFQNSSATFDKDVELSVQALKKHFILKAPIHDIGFYRVVVVQPKTDVHLKIEWINDVAYRKGIVQSQKLFPKIDSWINILSNKVSALSRAAAKDVADLIFLSLNYDFSWKEVVNDARQKDTWVNEIQVSKILYDFDSNHFHSVHWIDSANGTRDFTPELKIIARDLLHGFDNSLVKTNNGKI